MYIRDLKPNLNEQIQSYKLSLFKQETGDKLIGACSEITYIKVLDIRPTINAIIYNCNFNI